MPLTHRQHPDIGVVHILNVAHVMHGLAAATEAIARPFVIRRIGKQPHSLFHVAKPPVGIPPIFAGQATRVEDMSVPDIVGGQRKTRPFLYGYVRSQSG